MCISATKWMPSDTLSFSMQKSRSKRHRVRIPKLRRKRCEEKLGTDMEYLKNVKLYMENLSILEENEKLRKKVSLLHQENLALMTELQKNSSQFGCVSTTLNLLLYKQQY